MNTKMRVSFHNKGKWLIGTVTMPGTGQEMVKATCPEKSTPELLEKQLSVWGVFQL